MFKQIWQLLFPFKSEPIADRKITDRSNDLLLSLESEIQTLLLTIADHHQTISKLRTEGDRQRQNEESKQAIALQTQFPSYSYKKLYKLRCNDFSRAKNFIF